MPGPQRVGAMMLRHLLAVLTLLAQKSTKEDGAGALNSDILGVEFWVGKMK